MDVIAAPLVELARDGYVMAVWDTIVLAAAWASRRRWRR
jgi:hypothetical protein